MFTARNIPELAGSPRRGLWMTIKSISCAQAILLLICFGFPADAGANAADPPTDNADANKRKLTLAEVKQTSFQRNWDFLAAKSGVDLATDQQIVAREYQKPELDISTAKIAYHDI